MRRARLAFIFFAIAFLTHSAPENENCTVTEHRARSIVAGTFLIGDQTVRVTLPAGVVESNPIEVFVESTGPQQDLLIGTGEEMVPLKNGTVLHPPTGRGKRKDLFITTAAGEMVCAWKPNIGLTPLTQAGKSIALNSARQIARHLVFYAVTGDPIFFYHTDAKLGHGPAGNKVLPHSARNDQKRKLSNQL